MASSGPFPFDNSHRQRHSVSHSPSNRRPSTSPTPTRPLPSSSSPLVFLYDSPPIPGDPDYLGEDLFVPVRRNRNSNHNRDTGTRGIGTGIRTEIDQTAETLPSTAATTTAAVAGNINNSNSGTTLTTSPSTTSHPSASQPLASLLPRPRSAGGNRNDLNTPVYSTSTSARTSYTRVDLTAMEPSVNLESHVASGQAERRDENGGSEAGREGGGVEESLPSSSLLAVTTTTTTTTSELTQQQQSQPQEEGNFNSSAQQQPTPSTPIPQTPQVALCFLLISGKRRVMQFEPETTVGRVKELVWNAWPSDWQDEQPPTPWHLRLLYLGKILQDDDTLKGLSFPIHTPPSQSETQPQETQPPPLPTIVHLSVRPFGPGAPTPDDEIKKKRKSVRIPRWGSTMASGNDGLGTDVPSETIEGGGGGGGLGNGGARTRGMCCGCVIS